MNMCRICLSNGPLKDIFETHNNEESYVDIINFCLGIQLTELTTTITKLCIKCARKLMTFYKFKSLALKNDTYLQRIHEYAVVKLENIAYNTYIKCEEESLCDNAINEDYDSLEIKYEYTVDEDTALTADVDTELNANIDIEFTADTPFDEELEHKPLSDTNRIKDEQNKVVIKQKGKLGRKPTEGKRKKIKYPVKKKMCPDCGKEVNDLRQHSVVHMPKESRRRYPCDLCDLVLCSRSSKRRHIQARHSGNKPICKICNKAVSTIDSHMRLKHDRESLPHSCTVCGRAFLIASTLAAHMVTHSTERPFQCDNCSATFRTKYRLRIHIRRVHLMERSLLCQFCSKSFFRADKLKEHLRTHTKEKPFKCPECGKRFTTAYILKNHRLIHADEKKYACTECNMTFKKKEYLTPHMISHTKEKRHPCQYCGVKFGRSDHRKRHEFTAHLQYLNAANT